MIGATTFDDMADSYFVPVDETSDGGRYLSGPATVGPWDERLQHGGPPSALAVLVAERAIRAETGRTDLLALRIAADFVGPVPVDEIEARARVLRAARSAALVEVTLAAGERPCLLARVWFVRNSDTAHIAAPLAEPADIPDVPTGLDYSFGYGASLEWRFVRGRMAEAGPAAAWVRPTLPIVTGRQMSALSRAALIADSASGISAELAWSEWSFLNVDLDIHLARPAEGEWLLMEAATQLGAHGSALARSTLSDVRGVLGSGLQTLVVAPMHGRQ
jgi:Acyl-CoA thioesterase C-terminal domain/Acyl-CoA thioesterase N-terminal domain